MSSDSEQIVITPFLPTLPADDARFEREAEQRFQAFAGERAERRASAPAIDPRVADLELRLAQAETERDRLKALHKSGPSRMEAKAKDNGVTHPFMLALTRTADAIKSYIDRGVESSADMQRAQAKRIAALEERILQLEELLTNPE